MSILHTDFNPADPETVWDGLSENPGRISRMDDQAPDPRDWDRMVAEVIAIQEELTAPSGEGTVASNTTVEELGSLVHRTVLTLDGVVLTTTDDATHGAFTSKELYDFPEGHILVLGAIAKLALAAGVGGLSDTAAIVAGVGTSAAAQSSGDGTLGTTEANIIPSTAFTLSGGTKAATAAVSTGTLAADGHSSAKKAYLNFQCPTAGSSAVDTLTVTGTVTISWVSLGDV